MATPCERAARRISSLFASASVGAGLSRCSRRDDPLGEVVADLELAVATRDRDVAHHEHVVEGASAGRPVPPPVHLLPRQAVVEVAGGRCSAIGDLREQAVGELLGDDAAPPLVAAVAVARHPVSHHRPQVDRHERLDVGPVLHHPAWPALRRAAYEVDVVGTHACVERHVVGPLQHVHGVDLEHTGAVQGARERSHRRRGVARVEEALGRQRDATRLGPRERRAGGRVQGRGTHGREPSGSRGQTSYAGRTRCRPQG